jgi:hypothetical protein
MFAGGTPDRHQRERHGAVDLGLARRSRLKISKPESRAADAFTSFAQSQRSPRAPRAGGRSTFARVAKG